MPTSRTADRWRTTAPAVPARSRDPYSQSVSPRLRARVGALIVAASVALTAGGCSTSYKLGSLLGTDDPASDHTDKTTARPEAAKVAAVAPGAGDLAAAKRAAVEVLATGNKDASVPWENPRTGARGTVTPLASAYQQGDATCHDFLASYVHGDQESWYQGGACRAGATWEVREIRPLRRT
jgi:surface antigen